MLSNKGLEAYLLELDSSWGISYFLIKVYNDPFLWRREPMYVLIQPYSLYFIWQLDLFINQVMVNYQYK